MAVSNFEQTATDHGTSTLRTANPADNQEFVIAAGFNTGSVGDAYTLSSIAVKTPAGQATSTGGAIKAELWSAAASTGNPPDEKLYDLTVPDVSAGAQTVTFTAPPHATMATGTLHYLVVHTTDTTAFRMLDTDSDDEDGTPASGWSIPDGDPWQVVGRVPAGGTWVQSASYGDTALIQVSVYAAGQAANPTDLSALTAESSTDNSTFSSLTLNPEFAADTIWYRAAVANDTTHVRLTPTLADASSRVEVGKAGSQASVVSSGSPSDGIALDVGDNAILVEVIDTNNVANIYTVNVYRTAADLLVTNLGQAVSSRGELGTDPYAQSFTTGSHAAGYTLRSIDATFEVLRTVSSSDAAKVEAELWSAVAAGANAGQPDAKLYDLTVPTSISAGVLTFTAPSNTVLAADTTYILVLYLSSSLATGVEINWTITDSNSEDLGQTGWSVEDDGLIGTDIAGVITWSSGDPYHVSVNGAEAQAQADPLNLSALTAEGSTDGNNFAALSGAAALVPAFDAATTTYRATVGNDTTHVRLTPTLADTNSSVEVGRAPSLASVNSGSPSHGIALDVGDNEITVEVIDTNNIARGYTVNVRRVPAGTEWYATLNVKGLSSSRIGCQSTHSTDEFKCSTASTLTSKDFSIGGDTYEVSYILDQLISGADSLIMEVTEVTNAEFRELNFCSGPTAYPVSDAASGGQTAASELVWRNTDVGWSAGDLVSLSFGTSCAATDLSALTAEGSTDGGSNFAALSGAAALAPAFAAATTTYRATVGNDTTHVRLTPTLAYTNSSVEVGRAGGRLTTVNSGDPSSAIALDVGDNAITVRVTDTDGATQDYTVTVRRVPSGSVWWATLTVRDFNVFACDNTLSGYECTVTSILTDDGPFMVGTATISIEALETTTSGDFSGRFSGSNNALKALNFCVGSTAVPLSGLTSSHGLSTPAGTVTPWTPGTPVSLSIGTSCSLTDLSGLTAESSADGNTFAALDLDPEFALATAAYRAMVANDVAHVRLTPTLADTGSSVKVGKAGTLASVNNGSPSAAIALDVGDNEIIVEVTASNAAGSTRSYTVRVWRVAAGVLVTNLGWAKGSGRNLDTNYATQGFTTGSAAGGYPLQSIDALIEITGTVSAADAAKVRAELWSTVTTGPNAGEPNAKLYDLTAPTSISDGALTFEAPASTVLAADTTYHFVLYLTGALATGVAISWTDTDSDNELGQTGWSMGDQRHRSSLIQGNLDWFVNTAPYFVRVNGAEASPPAPTTGDPGDLDTGFGTGGKVTTAIGSAGDRGYAVAEQPDGKIVVAGSSYNGSNRDFALVRYNANGTPDTDFGTGGKVTTAIGNGDDEAYAVAIQGDGKIVVAGEAGNGTNKDFAVARYNADGTLDTTFGTVSGQTRTGKLITTFGSGNDHARAVAIDSNDNIVVAGWAEISSQQSDFALARYTSDGDLDTGFDTDGKVNTRFGSTNNARQEGRAMIIQSDGKIVVAGNGGNGSDQDFLVARYTANDALDTGFNSTGWVQTAVGSSISDAAYGVAVDANGNIVLAGETGATGSLDVALVRYTSAGALDTTFDSDGKVTTAIGSAGDRARAVRIDADGKIVVGGYSYNGSDQDFAVLRYNTDGTLDTTFGQDGMDTGDDPDGYVTTAIGTGTSDEAHDMTLDSSGNILLAGFRVDNGNADIALARYNPVPRALTVLVSNILKSRQLYSEVASTVRGQGFTTGSQTGGYALGSIDLLLETTSTSAQRDTIHAELWSAASTGAPDSKLYDLTVPHHPIAAVGTSHTNSARVSFVAPANTMLEASTKYFLVVYTVGAFQMRYRIRCQGWPVGSAGDQKADHSSRLHSRSAAVYASQPRCALGPSSRALSAAGPGL